MSISLDFQLNYEALYEPMGWCTSNFDVFRTNEKFREKSVFIVQQIYENWGTG